MLEMLAITDEAGLSRPSHPATPPRTHGNAVLSESSECNDTAVLIGRTKASLVFLSLHPIALHPPDRAPLTCAYGRSKKAGQ